MSGVETRLAELERDHAARQKAVEVAKDYRQVSRGYGFVCGECRCEIDEYIRGPHQPGCSLAVHNESVLPGWEAFAGFIQRAE